MKPVRIRNFLHKGLKALYLEDQSRSLPADAADKLRNMLAFLQDMRDEEELRSIPVWRSHVMKGNRQGGLEFARHAQLASDVSHRL